MQLLVELGSKVQNPEGIVLQEDIKAKARDIVSSQRDQSVTTHYSELSRFAREKAIQLGLLSYKQ